MSSGKPSTVFTDRINKLARKFRDMCGSDDLLGAKSDVAIERGQTYNHSEHGQVEVTGIWKGVKQVDKARHTEEEDTFIVRYSAEINGININELTDTLDEFIQAVK